MRTPLEYPTPTILPIEACEAETGSPTNEKSQIEKADERTLTMEEKSSSGINSLPTVYIVFLPNIRIPRANDKPLRSNNRIML